MSHGGFSCSSKLLQKKWAEKSYKVHRQRMLTIRSHISEYQTRKSNSYPHLILRVKRVQKEEDRQAQIDYQNELLIQRMTKIMRSHGSLDNWNDYKTRSKNIKHREKEQDRIAKENLVLAHRLDNVKSEYHPQDWEEDYKRHNYYLEMWASTTKDYTESPRQQRRQRDSRASRPSQSHAKSQDLYESDFEDPDDDGSDSEKLPRINPQEKEKSPRKKKESSSVPELPDIKENQTEAAAEMDAKTLQKAIKNKENRNQVILKTLIRKSHIERMRTKDKYEDLYDKDLADELKSFGAGYEPLVECLLAEREDRDAEATNTYIHENDVPSLINLFCFRNQSAIQSINMAYEKSYDVGIQADIEDRILNVDCQKLLIALLECDKSDADIDEKQAKNDAKNLFEGGTGRFTDPDGVFLKLFKTKSLAHIKAVLHNYKSVSEGQDISTSMKSAGCMKDYINAVQTIVKCMNNGAILNAEKLHSLIQTASNRELISLLLARAEIDMPEIRKAYKKKYSKELTDNIMKYCGDDVGPLIAHIAAKKSKPDDKSADTKKKDKDQSSSTGKSQGQKHSQLSNKSSPRRPEPQRSKPAQNNPPAKSSQQKKSMPGKGSTKSVESKGTGKD